MELEPRVCEARDLDFNHDLMQNPQRITTSSYLLSPCIRFPQKKKKKSPEAEVFIHVCDVTPLFPSSIASLSILYLSYSPFLSPLVLFPLLTNGTRYLASQIVSAPSYPSIHKIESLTHYIPFFFFFFFFFQVSACSLLYALTALLQLF